MLFLSALFSAIFVIAIHSSAEYVPSGTTSIIVNLCPIVVLTYSCFYLQESVSLKKLVGFSLGVIGGLVFLYESISIHAEMVFGLLLAIIGMFPWGAYTITLDYLHDADPYIVMTVKHVTSTLMIIPFVLLLLVGNVSLILVIDMWTIMGLVFAGVLASGLAYVLYFSAIEALGAAKASSFLFLVPFVSLAGDFLLGESPTIVALFAGIIALIGVALIRLDKARKQSKINEFD
jgi:drug/metabolite transporter (DMT)-like permease